MSAITEKTDRLFIDAKHSKEDLGYPDDVAFLAADEEWAEEALRHRLSEGVATVVVFENSELLLVPLRRSPLDHLRGRVPVRVAPRANGRPAQYATRSRLGRRPLAEMRDLAHA
jgi:hypothetical protein